MPDDPAAHLPAELTLAPHRTLLHCGAGSRVIGLDPARGVVVEELSAPLAALLDELTVPVARDALLSRAVRAGADQSAAVGLLIELVTAGVVVDASGPSRTARRRADAVVRVCGDGPLAVGIAHGLGLAGIGTVVVQAGGTVAAADLGTGYLDRDIGRPRAAAAAAAVGRVAPATRTTRRARSAPDLIVLADALTVEPATARSLTAAGVEHLHVRLRDGRGVVGPLVLPGRSACLECLERRRAEHDPSWPAIATQLDGVRGGADPPTAVATAGLATAQALAAVDGPAAGPVAPAAVDATLELDVAAGTLIRRTWAVCPDCHCRAAPHARPPRLGRQS
ncbi:TOMM precursor leader peptide-binding protein [Pseudonocardia asaccharolytica]|uniref:Thiamin biosynthesis protein n=1 Tax=Pseudonocardia asaccharolytica DSM 44247 = NBRC 16224 TaxID=1123024 RepID=A0A511D4X9_9PSEU|nr:TOMM precursor leader peptide-binding protein [Pseudonocardia asaccharolytica]GEL18654.1 thiamin biosynthesis protein [Pseudonocardia asaccharolytica DSM 44247 = NBRC 16224]